MSPGEKLQGQFYVANIGDAESRIAEAYLTFWTSRDPLPMERPYEGKNGNLVVRQNWIAPGSSIPVTFDEPLETPDKMDSSFVNETMQVIFAMGWVEYEDRAGNTRRTAYCRSYDSRTRRFIRGIDDPDYESED